MWIIAPLSWRPSRSKLILILLENEMGRILQNGRIDLLVLGCEDADAYFRIIKDMFTVELQEIPQWCKFDFHVRAYPIDMDNFPFQRRTKRRIRRAKTKLLVVTEELLENAEDDPEFVADISELLERGHLIAMNDNLPVASFDAFISSLGKRAKDINKLETNEVSKLFAGTINLLAKPMYQIQEFLPFPQNISAADPGEICLLAEDELDPYQDYMVSFKQGETEIDSIGDMISKQSITLPIPNGLKPGQVEIRIYPVKYGRRLSELVGKSVIFLEESELDKTTIETFLFKKFKRPLDELINNTLCSLLCENEDRSFENYCEQKHLHESLATIKCFNSINRSLYENEEPPRKRLKEVFKSQSIETQTELKMSSTECQTEPVNLTRESHEAIKSEPKAEVQVDQAPEEKQKNSKLEERIKEQERKRKIEQSVKSIKNGNDSTPPKSVARKVLAPSIDAKPCQPRALPVKPVEIKQNVIEDSKKNEEQKIDLLNPKFDLRIIADEDERWQKRQERKNVPVIAVRSSSGKVKKGSGFRYDKKRGYDRYFSSSEEETASEDEEDELNNQNGVDDGCEDLFIPQYTANSHSIYSF